MYRSIFSDLQQYMQWHLLLLNGVQVLGSAAQYPFLLSPTIA